MPIRTRTLPCLSFAFGLAAAHLFATPATEPAAVPPDRKPLPEGPGLSARYPGDAGIAGDPAVIYATGFENGIEAPLRPRRKGVSVVQDPALARGGNTPTYAYRWGGSAGLRPQRRRGRAHRPLRQPRHRQGVHRPDRATQAQGWRSMCWWSNRDQLAEHERGR